MDNIPDCQYEYRHETLVSKIIDTCIECGDFIQESDDYYDIRGIILCEECMKLYKKGGRIND